MVNYGDYPDLQQVKRVLVIKLRHLGDVLLASPVFSQLKKALPYAQIDAYIWKEAKAMLEGHSGISDFILYDRKWKTLSLAKRLVKEMGLLRAIRAQNYDLIVNLTEGDRGAVAAFVSGASLKVGVDPGKQGMRGKRNFYTHLVKSCPTPRHTVERDLDSLRRIGIFPLPEERNLEFFVSEETKFSVQKQMQLEGLCEGEFTLIHPVSRWLFKCLPPRLIAEVIDRLEEPVVLTGGGSEQEQEMLREITQLTKAKVVNLGGKTTLKEMGAWLLLSRGLITVDSVALHMASALQVPVVALFGPTSEENWGPWRHPKALVVAEKRECRPCRLDGCGGSKRSDCLWTLSPRDIVNGYKKLTVTSLPLMK